MNGRVYALIGLGNATLTGVLSGWLLYFYAYPGMQPLVPIVLFGIAILLSRVIYVLVSLWFDGLVRQHRLAWLVGGALCMPVLFVLLWAPPHSGNSPAGLLYLALVLIGFNLASAIQMSAYEALGPDLQIGEKEREALANWRMGFLLAGNILAGFAGPVIETLGYARGMWIFAGISAAALILPGLWLSVRLKTTPATTQAAGEPLAARMKAAWSRRGFRLFALSWGLMWLASTFTYETLPYIVTEICGGSAADAAYFYFTALLVGLLAYPAVMKLAGRYGAPAVFRGSLLAGALVTPGLLLIGQGIPLPALLQGVVWMAVQAACLAGAVSLPGAISALSGAGDQGTFGNLIDQLASGIALAIVPCFLLLGRGAADPQGALGVRLLALAGGGFLLAAFVAFGRFKPEKGPNLS